MRAGKERGIDSRQSTRALGAVISGVESAASFMSIQSERGQNTTSLEPLDMAPPVAGGVGGALIGGALLVAWMKGSAKRGRRIRISEKI